MNDIPYLKRVSRVKHAILRNYLDPWAAILGSAHTRLAYVDCFAGGGVYVDEQGNQLPGSPAIALHLAKEYVNRRPDRSLVLIFVERDHDTAQALRDTLQEEGGTSEAVTYFVEQEDAADVIERLISHIESKGPRARIIPTFFFVDPYGHPVTVPIMKRLLALGQTEVLVNLMWYRINMDLSNPKVQPNVDKLFGHNMWRTQQFVNLHGIDREQAFVTYFVSQVGAKFNLKFAVRFSPEDKVPGGERRTKFYLLHFSGHSKAALLMKEVMWRLSDDVTELQFSGRGGNQQLRLIESVPDLEQLRCNLIARFDRQSATFDTIRLETLDWPFVEKHYRKVLKELEQNGVVTIRRMDSKERGLRGRDVICFPGAPR